METAALDKIFNPKSIAVIGASDRPGSVGYIVFSNLSNHFQAGPVYAVNNKRDQVQGKPSVHSVLEVGQPIDLAVICTPAAAVKAVVEECGKAGIKGLIIISAGFAELGSEGKQLLADINEIRKTYGMSVVGPNCLGVIIPEINMNSTFADSDVLPGKSVFISQSGALGCAVLDWAKSNGVGMRAFISVGSMMDVDFGDLINYFGQDPKTEAFFIYMESLTDAEKFIEAASRMSHTKPIFAIKSGREAEGAKAAASHTGALAGEDSLYDAAFKKAGITRIGDSARFLDVFKAVSFDGLPRGNRLIILTNAGGPGVMATDCLVRGHGKLAELSSESKAGLSAFLPAFWSHSNPIDILGDAGQDRYSQALDILVKEPNADAVLVLLTPQAMTECTEIARRVVEISKSSRRPVFAAWMGEGRVAEGRKVLLQGGIPSYESPEDAIGAFLSLSQAGMLLNEAQEVVHSDNVPSPDLESIRKLLGEISQSGRTILSEQESKQILEIYGLKTTQPTLARNPQEAARIASQIGFPVAMKVQSEDITHKTDANAVMLGIRDEASAARKFEEIIANAHDYKPDAAIEGVSVQKMVEERGFELILGSKRDTLFGPSVLFGLGGISVEILKDTSIELAPLTSREAMRLIKSTKAGALLEKGYRNLAPANLVLLIDTIVRFSHLAADLPEIGEIDINPLLVSDKSCIVLDARMVLRSN